MLSGHDPPLDGLLAAEDPTSRRARTRVAGSKDREGELLTRHNHAVPRRRAPAHNGLLFPSRLPIMLSARSLLAFALLGACTLPLIPGCTTGPSTRAASAAVDRPELELTGSRIIACCCPSPCPCRINKKPTHCHGCDHSDAVHVEKGHIGGVRMDGVTWVVTGRGFGQDTASNWVYVYVSDNATDEQFKALQGMLNADVASWGPKAAHLAGKFVGMRKVPITYTKDGGEWSTTIPGILELRTRAIYNPGRKNPAMSTGILDAFGDRFVHADCLVHKLHDAETGYQWDLTGRQCNQADFVLDRERIAKGGIGWGCWTAHADLGDKEPYGEQLIGH
jgi:hypothetical protein